MCGVQLVRCQRIKKISNHNFDVVYHHKVVATQMFTLTTNIWHLANLSSFWTTPHFNSEEEAGLSNLVYASTLAYLGNTLSVLMRKLQSKIEIFKNATERPSYFCYVLYESFSPESRKIQKVIYFCLCSTIAAKLY